MGLLAAELGQLPTPPLDEGRIALLRPFGEIRATNVGDVLFRAGDPNYPLVVVLSGQTEIIDDSERIPNVIATSGPGEFLAELGILTGQTTFVSCVVRQSGEVLLVPPAAVREIINTIPALSDVLVTAFAVRRQALMRYAAATLTLIGPEESPSILRLREFAERNRIPHRWLPPEDPSAMQVNFMEWPPDPRGVRVLVRGRRVLRDPSNLELARALGLELTVREEAPVDLVVVGTGPAGLSAAVYGASEGLSTIAVDDVAIGGQAGTSSRIENYLGFPTGISGGDLAFRAEVQALKFGARVTVPRQATRLEREDGHFVVWLDDNTALRGRSVIIATGARYRRLGLPRQEEFEGSGIYYAATELEARLCRDAEVVVVGGGNSAGQAAMFLSGTARRVHLIYRGADLDQSMSHYLIARLDYAPNVRVRTNSEVCELHGDERLDAVVIASNEVERETVSARAVFVMIGSDPCTDWLRDTIDLDERGFVLTGQPRPDSGVISPYESSAPGVFAIGDVRSGSVKRVASAVGEGSVVVQSVHHYLASHNEIAHEANGVQR